LKRQLALVRPKLFELHQLLVYHILNHVCLLLDWLRLRLWSCGLLVDNWAGCAERGCREGSDSIVDDCWNTFILFYMVGGKNPIIGIHRELAAHHLSGIILNDDDAWNKRNKKGFSTIICMCSTYSMFVYTCKVCVLYIRI
jgi:hypothetical protein